MRYGCIAGLSQVIVSGSRAVLPAERRPLGRLRCSCCLGRVRSRSDETNMAETKTAGLEPPESLKMLELRYGHFPEFRNAVIATWTHSIMTPELLHEWRRFVDTTDHPLMALPTPALPRSAASP